MKGKPLIRLHNVYSDPRAAEILYALLKERENKINISHRAMPTPKEHRRFITSRPYKGWFILRDGAEAVGSVYLSKNNEIGLFIFKRYRAKGYGDAALSALMKKFSGTERFLANINPKNGRSIRFFKRRGFRHIQNTYELRRIS